MDLTELKPTIVIYVGNGKVESITDQSGLCFMPDGELKLYANYATELEQLIEDIEQLTAERDFLLFATQKISDVLLPNKEGRFTPCNPDFLIKSLADEAKRLQEYEKRLLWLADFIADSTHDVIIDVFGECYCASHVIQNIDDCMADRI